MKILNIHIDNFGKLSDVEIDFSNNPNVIFEENGWGKSTLATFIKVMFYGFDGESKKKRIDKEREKYRPWNKGIYGGSILIEINNKEFELTRHFGTKEKDDSGSLVDITTNLETKEYDYTRLGEQLFSIDMDAFMRTVYLGQGNIAVHVSDDGIGDSIAAKISNLAEATDDINNYDRVMKAFKESMNSLKSGSKFGDINKLNASKTELEAHIRQADYVDAAITELENSLKTNEAKCITLSESKDKLDKEFVAAGEIGRYEEWKKNHDSLLADNEKYKQQLSEARIAATEVEGAVKIFDESEIKIQIANLDRFEECRELEKETESKIDNAQYRYDTELRIAQDKRQRDYDEAKAKKEREIEEATKKAKNKKVGIMLLSAVIVLVIIGLFIIHQPILASAVLVVLIVGLIIAFVTNSKQTVNVNEVDIKPVEYYFAGKDELDKQIRELNEQKLKASHDAREAESFVRQFFELMEMDYSAKSARQELISLKDNNKNKLQMQNERNKRLEQAQKDYEESCRKIEESEKSSSAKVPEVIDDVRTTDIIANERKQVEQEIEQIKKNIAIYKGQLSEKRELRDSILQSEEKLDIIKENLEEYEHRYGIIQKTADYMSKAKETLNSLYMNPIAEAYKKYYGYVADDMDEYEIDANINITKKELGEKRRADNLSCGYKDLVDIALRMALIDVMYDDEKPFIILDDPFVNLDTDKLARAKEMLNAIARKYQVIYFTCHESRV